MTTDRPSSTRYANKRSPVSSTTIAIPTEATDKSTKAPAIKVGDKCLILAAPYIQWNATHKYPDREFTWMRHVFTISQVKSTVAVVVSGEIRKQVPIDSIQVISGATLEEIRSPPKVKAIDQALPPISITELLNLSDTSKIAQESAVITKDDETLIELCQWLLDSPKLPTPPFQLHPAVIAIDGYLESLKSEATATIDWAQGRRSKKHPRHICGALMRDLLRLRELSG